MYALHPFSVHFPIALLLVSSLFTVLAVRSAHGSWDSSAYHCLVVGWLAGVVAVLTGLLDAGRQLVGPDVPRDNELIGWVNAHAFVNIAALVVYGQALLRRKRNPAVLAAGRARRDYLWLHAVGVVLIVVGGWLGGHLVYVLGLGLGT